MIQMKKSKKLKKKTFGDEKRSSLRSKVKNRANTYNVLVYTERGEKLTYRIPSKRGIYKISDKSGISYSHIKIAGNLRVNSKIALYSHGGVVKGTVKRMTLSGPSTDVESGNIPPIKRPGGH